MHRFVYRVHALQRMFEREIERSVVESVIQSGTTIESYPEDTPYPSRLVLGDWCETRHTVFRTWQPCGFQGSRSVLLGLMHQLSRMGPQSPRTCGDCG